MYGEFDGPVDRDEITVEHFQGWMQWARGQQISLDLNPSCFSHPRADEGFTLSHPDAGVRQFWIDHCAATRRIAAAMGQSQRNPCINNVWVPDGFKDTPVNRAGARRRLADSLDSVFEESLDRSQMLD